jgi:hypothetical protein
MKHLFIASALLLMSCPAEAAQTFAPISTTGPLTGLSLVTGINNNDNSLKTSFSGSSSPSTPVAGQFWFDTSVAAMKFYDGSTFQTLSPTTAGGGTVNAALINQIAWYSANGSAVSGLSTANNGVLRTNSSGVPSVSTTLPSGLTIPGYLTGNQTVTLSGDLSGSGATSISATISSNAVTFAKFQQLGANTIVGNGTGSTANATALAVPSCSGATNALTWTSGTGFGCNTITGGGGGSGTVNSGTQYQLGYYATTGTAISGLAGIKTDVSNNLIVSSGLIGVGTAAPRAALDLATKTTSLALPVGTTGQRPGSPIAGMTRYNSTLHRIEAYINNTWTSLSVGHNAVNITLPPYSAVCDGSTSTNTAFTNAFSDGFDAYVPPTSTGCAVSNLTVPSNARIVGRNPRPWYDVTSGTRSFITSVSGATQILNVNGSLNVSLRDIDIMGRGAVWGSNIQCMSGGSTSLNLENVSMRFCGNGCVGSNSDAYTNGLFSLFSNFYACGQNSYSGGINNVIDSQIIGGAVTSSFHGIYLATGADSNAFMGVRTEWNVSYGILCSGCATNVFNGVTVDANGDTGLYLQNANNNRFDGYFWRNGTTATAGKQSHIVDAGGNSDIVISGVFKKGYDDGGGGTERPKYVVETTATGTAGFDISTSSMRGGYVTAPYLFTANPTSYTLRGADTGKAVSVSTCGTSPSVAGNDYAGVISVGSGSVTACTLTFGNTNWRTRACSMSTSANVTSYISSASSSAITVTTSSSVGSGKIYYNCEP